jgi:hypothetical protein
MCNGRPDPDSMLLILYPDMSSLLSVFGLEKGLGPFILIFW